ncbi:MAG: glycoside hydrolase family 2, partial [Bacteroidales bacterium]|nr:glycoside hydrolase family 2 [Bacteroidales bacterium]
YKNFMGVATYTASFNVPAGSLPKYLNLGKVGYIAEVTINGKPAGLHWYGDAVLDVTGLLKTGDNNIEVKVTTLMSNYLQTLKDNRIVQRFVLRRNTPLKPAGLIGPVVLY